MFGGDLRSTLRPYITISFMIYELFFFVIQRSFSDEESRKHKVGVTEILRFTLDDNLLFLKLLKGLKGLSSFLCMAGKARRINQMVSLVG